MAVLQCSTLVPGWLEDDNGGSVIYMLDEEGKTFESVVFHVKMPFPVFF